MQGIKMAQPFLAEIIKPKEEKDEKNKFSISYGIDHVSCIRVSRSIICMHIGSNRL
jgi:hypothetical protein